jgi:hypothetical protein
MRPSMRSSQWSLLSSSAWLKAHLIWHSIRYLWFIKGESNMAIHTDWGRSSSRFFNVIRIWGGTTIDVPVSGPIVSYIYFTFVISLTLCWEIATPVKLRGFINLLCSQVLGEQAITFPETLPKTCSSKITNKFSDLQIFRAWLICVQQKLHQLCFNATTQ